MTPRIDQAIVLLIQPRQDMVRMLQIYHESGFDGPIRPDHAPTMEGEPNDRPGYAMTGKVFVIGYMTGIMKALHIPYE